jgi:hypothetical protein
MLLDDFYNSLSEKLYIDAPISADAQDQVGNDRLEYAA